MMINAKAEAEAGRVAADRISDEWDDRAWVPQSPTYEWAHAAIERLSELFAGQRGMFKASLEGAERGARSLSPRPFQGLVECLQNADDLGATCLQIAYRSLPTPELLIAHNGAPVTLANVAGMLLPWLSTKKDDADAAGRFGIGQRTLGSLGGPISVHAPPFHFSIYSSGPQAVTPYPDVPGVYQASRRDTLLTIPLFDSVSAEKVAEAVQQLNVDALLFLRSIRTLQFHNLEDPAQNLSFSVEVTPRPGSTISFDGAVTPVEIVDVALCRPAGRPMVYRRYSTHRPIRSTTTRANKATGATTSIGICVPLQPPQDALPLYDRMPLPVQSGLFIGLNAQFDPDAARSTLIPNDWNSDRFKDLGLLTSWAALEYFESGDVAGWNHIPLAAEVNNSGSWIAEQVLDLVVEASHTILMDSLTVLTAASSTPIDELAYEIAELEQLLDEYDIERLCVGKVALPRTQRDGPGRWRPVLAELGRSTVVDVEDALDILNGDTARPANWYVLFASIVEQHDLVKEFTSRQSLLLADGTTTGLPAAAENWVLVKSALPNSLTARLGFTRQLHPAYFVEGAGVEAFLAGLKKRHVLFDNQDVPTDVFQILKRGSVEEGATLTAIRLHEPELLALRDAWAELQRDQRDAIGIRVGQRVELKAFWYLPGGKRVTGWSRLAELYMPAAVDRDTDSFAKAAGKTPGLKWVDGEYVKILKPSVSRASLGARSLLSAWGVAREPRLIRPLDEASVWARDTRPASPVRSKIRTPDHLESIQLTGSYGYLLNDHWSPDADAVVEDIARSPVKVGRVRGEALLAVLSRAWEKRYADAALTQPVNGSQGYWHPGTEVRATWLARLAAVKWLPDAGNSLQRPSSLRLQAPGASTKPGERSTTLARVDSQIYRSGVLPALAVRAGPTQQELVQQLRALRNEQVTPDIAGEALAIYQLLSASLRSRNEAAPEGRMTSSQFKNAFRGSVKERGLLLVDGQWHSPESLLRGPAIFGEYKTFAPHVEGIEQLWVALGVPLPSATDAISVLREISSTSATPSPEDLGVMIRAFTLLADGMASLTTQMRTSLRRLPLWTGTAWTKDRPVYALEGDSLQDVAPPTIRVWRLGLSTFGPIKSALDTLGVVHLSLSDFKAESGTALGVAEGEAIRPKFAKAIALLRQEFVRSDQGLLDGLCLSWDKLATATVVINPNLTIVADLPSGPLRLLARAHINRDPLYLVLKCPEEAATDLGAGAAIASLFHGDQKKISWAWAAVWPRAVYGEQAQGAILRSTRAEQADDASRLDKLAEQVGERSARKKPVGKTGAAASNLMSPPVQVRKLKDLADLLPSMGTIVNPGAKPRGDLVFGKRRSSTRTREFDPTALVPASTQAAHRSVLPPTDEREKLALEVVMRALRLDHHQLNDLRDIRGVGVDAIDDLRQCYEIKMSSGAGIPNEITLTAREVEAAREDPDFFLAIVSGLEDGAGKLRVNFIFDPLSRLDVKVSSDLTLTGIKDAEKLEFEFNKA